MKEAGKEVKAYITKPLTSHTQLKKMAGIGIVISNMVFLSLFVGLAINNRFATDDFTNLSITRKEGIIGAMLNMYHTASGRWASTLIADGVTKAVSIWFPVLALYNCIYLVALVAGIAALAKYFFAAKGSISNLQYLNIALFFVQFCFYITPCKGEIWFWLNGTSIYLVSVIALIWGTYFLLVEKNCGNLLAGILCFLIAGGSAEGTSISGFFIFAIYGLNLYKDPNTAINKKRKKYFIVFLCALSIGFIVNLLAPGNFTRLDNLQGRAITTGVYLFFNTLLHIGLSTAIELPLAIGFCVPFFILGIYYPHFRVVKFTRVFLVFVLWSVCLILPSTYLLSDIAPARVLTIYYFVICLFIALIAMNSGFYSRRYQNHFLFKLSVVTICLGLVCFLVVNTYYQTGNAVCYSSKVDRMLKLPGPDLDLNFNNSVRADDPGYLYSGDIKNDGYYYPQLLKNKVH